MGLKCIPVCYQNQMSFSKNKVSLSKRSKQFCDKYFSWKNMLTANLAPTNTLFPFQNMLNPNRPQGPSDKGTSPEAPG